MASAFSITFSAVAVSVQQDLFELVAPTAGEVEICGFNLGQTSDHGDAAAEGLQVLLVRGHTTSGSGGGSFTPVQRSTKTEAAATVCEINNTSIATLGTAVNVYADAWNVQSGIAYWWPPENRPVLRNGERGVLRQSAPADAITLSGTLFILER